MYPLTHTTPRPFWWATRPAPRTFTEAEIVKALVDEKHHADHMLNRGGTSIASHLEAIYTIRLVAERLGLEKQYDAARSGE